MLFRRVRLASVEYLLPDEVVTSEQLETRLEGLYSKLHLQIGRLELMTGIRERRFFAPGTRPSAIAARAGERALAASGIERSRIGALIHASVCRDFLEPATASVVHHQLGLAPTCVAYDLSNACLGFVNALVTLAAQIDAGQLDAGLVVAGEDGRPLVEATIAELLARPTTSKADLKAAFASLTIGAGGAAAVLAREELAPRGCEMLGATSRAATEHHELCRGDARTSAAGLWMQTDSEALLQAGNQLATRTFADFLAELGLARDQVERIVTHQVGVAHRRLLLASLELDPARDFPTVETLGNIGSVSLPLTFARARESGFIQPGQRVAWLGIGSGLQSAMLALRA